MSATIAPATTGGMSASIQPVPVTMHDPADDGEQDADRHDPEEGAAHPVRSPWRAVIGAMNANDEPR